MKNFRDLLRLKLAKLHGHPNPSSLASEEIITLLRKGKNSNDLIEDVQEMLKNCDRNLSRWTYALPGAGGGMQ